MITDQKPSLFKRPPLRYYLAQLCGATVFISIVLYAMNTLSASHLIWAVGASSLASSAYIVFMHPHARSAKPRNIFMAYSLAIIVGEIIRYAMMYFGHTCHISTQSMMIAGHGFWLIPAISVIVVMMCMALIDIEHPPAAGIALVLVVELCRHDIVDIIFLLMVLLCIIQFISGALCVIFYVNFRVIICEQREQILTLILIAIQKYHAVRLQSKLLPLLFVY